MADGLKKILIHSLLEMALMIKQKYSGYPCIQSSAPLMNTTLGKMKLTFYQNFSEDSQKYIKRHSYKKNNSRLARMTLMAYFNVRLAWISPNGDKFAGMLLAQFKRSPPLSFYSLLYLLTKFKLNVAHFKCRQRDWSKWEHLQQFCQTYHSKIFCSKKLKNFY